MQVFKCALRVVLTHPVYVVVYVGFLSLLGLFVAMGVAPDTNAGSYEAVKAPFAVVDRDGSTLSERLAAFLGEHGEQVEVADESFAMQDAVATGQVKCVLVVPEGYERAFLEAARSGEEAVSYTHLSVGQGSSTARYEGEPLRSGNEAVGRAKGAHMMI